MDIKDTLFPSGETPMLPHTLMVLKRTSSLSLPLIAAALIHAGEKAPVSASEMAAGPRESVDLTVYNQGSALIREVREIALKKGLNQIVIPEVPTTLDPTSVHLSSAKGGLRVLEQNYQYDLPNTRTLLLRYVGKDVEFIRRDGLGGDRSFLGKLLAVEGEAGMNTQGPDGRNAGILAEIGGKIEVAPAGRMVLPSLPEGLILQPRLLWMAESEQAGRQKVELTYLADAISWTCEYVVLLSNGADKMDLKGWVTLQNESGSSFKNAGLKLVAGEVHREEARVQRFVAKQRMDFVAASAPAPQFAQSELFEYKLYALGRRTDLAGREKKQIELVTSQGAKCRKVLIYDGLDDAWHYWGRSGDSRNEQSFGQTGNTQVAAYVVFKNDKSSSLGQPLPAGRVRVFQKDVDGQPQLVGENQMGHTAKDEEVKLFLGNTFDVVGERAQTDFKNLSKGKVVEESFRIKVRNHKSEPVSVEVVEHPWRWQQWSVTKSNAPYSKVDQNTLKFPVQIPADSSAEIQYSVRYQFE
jgi:hypothetical protein